MERMDKELLFAKQHELPVACVVVNLDFFTVYLDSYGYSVTMEMVHYAASILQQQVRQEDVIARIRDDEFAMLLPQCSELGAQVLCERILAKLANTPFLKTLENGNPVEESLSFHAGVAGFPLVYEESVDADSLLRYAQHALHVSKFANDNDEDPVQLISAIRPVLS
jgi:diguanylate cyclase (GGDEF)-like protein